MTPFSTCFALLGLKLLFGNHTVTMGSVVLLACISAAVGSAWTGQVGPWMQAYVGPAFNATFHSSAPRLFGLDQTTLWRRLVCSVGVAPFVDPQCWENADA